MKNTQNYTTDYFKCNDAFSTAQLPPDISQVCIRMVMQKVVTVLALNGNSDEKREVNNKFAPKENPIIVEYVANNGVATTLQHCNYCKS